MSYRGIKIEIPLGHLGMTGEANQPNPPPGLLINSDNITFETGAISKEGGSTKFNTTAVGAVNILAGFDWFLDATTQRQVIYTSDGKIYKTTDGSSFTELKNSLAIISALVAPPVFVVGGIEAATNSRKLFCFNGVNNVQVLTADGASTADLATPPVAWGTVKPTAGFLHEGRLFVLAGHRLYYSTATNHEDFTGAGSGVIPVFTGQGQKIVCGRSYKGGAILWKYPTGIYFINTSSATTSEWRVEEVNTDLGMCSPLAAVEVENDILFQSNAGTYHFLSAVQATGSVATSSIDLHMKMQNYIQQHIATSRLAWVQAIYYEYKKEVHFATTPKGGITNAMRIVIDFNSQLAKFRISTKDTCESIWLVSTSGIQKPYSGDASGYIWKLDQSNKNKDGVGYSGSFQIAHDDFRWFDVKIADLLKWGDFIEVVVFPTGNYNLSLTPIWDGQSKDPIYFNLGQEGASLGSFVLGTDILSGEAMEGRVRKITGGGKRFSCLIANSGINQDFNINKIYLYCQIGEEAVS